MVNSDNLAIQNLEPEELNTKLNTNSYQSIGIHPWHIGNFEEQLQTIRKALTLSTNVVAIGEAGLDKSIDTKMEIQLNVFASQAYMAEEFNKPLIIHCVKAWAELIKVKKMVNPKTPWIIHGFRGNATLADQLINKELWLSFGQYNNPEAIKAAYPRIFAETDDSNVSIQQIYQQISTVLHIPINLVGIQLRENVRSVFSI